LFELNTQIDFKNWFIKGEKSKHTKELVDRKEGGREEEGFKVNVKPFQFSHLEVAFITLK